MGNNRFSPKKKLPFPEKLPIPEKLPTKKLPSKNKKIAVGLSGGVDSALAASLLVEKGYEVVGFHIHLWSEKGCNRCCGRDLLKVAKKTARLLGVSFYEVDFRLLFKKKVVDRVLREYSLGLTPNPCIFCNRLVRFGKMFEMVKKYGCDYLATGHYARVFQNMLYQAVDKKKDQSYFLYFLSEDQLRRVIFPLGKIKKEEVWQMARKRKLPAAKSLESFEVCFTNDLKSFLKRKIKAKSGKVVTVDGEVLGIHRGLSLYTIGFKGGWDWDPLEQKKWNKKEKLPRLYVVGMDSRRNQLIVGSRLDASRKEFQVMIDAGGSFWKKDCKLWVRIRSVGKLLKVLKLKEVESARRGLHKSWRLVVVLQSLEFGVSPGQVAVFYTKTPYGFRVVGGGKILTG